ncbi:MAG: hypothetical protein Q9178_000771 [Gyalolechia marmorata]
MADDPVVGTLEGSRMVPAEANKAELNERYGVVSDEVGYLLLSLMMMSLTLAEM